MIPGTVQSAVSDAEAFVWAVTRITPAQIVARRRQVVRFCDGTAVAVEPGVKNSVAADGWHIKRGACRRTPGDSKTKEALDRAGRVGRGPRFHRLLIMAASFRYYCC